MSNARRRRRGFLPAVAVACACALAVASAQQTPRQFRGGVELVAVDFLAVGPDGRPVPDLTPAEVSVRVDGRARTVRTLEFVKVADTGAAAATAPLPPPYGSNRVTDAGRDIFIVLDNDSFRPGRERPIRAAVETFVETLTARDRLALLTMPYGGVNADLTTDRARVLGALNQITGQAPTGESGSDAACRTRLTLQALSGMLGGLAGRESPATVVFFSSGLMGPRRDAAMALAPGMCELETREFQRVGMAAATARAQFYVVQPENILDARAVGRSESIGGLGFTGSDNPLEGLEHLTGVTGGRMLNLAKPDETALDRISRETSAYYLVAFEANESDRNSQNHRLELRVAREGVTVRTRPDIDMTPPAEAARATPATPTDMLRDARTFRDLPVRVSGYASRGAGASMLNVIAMAEPMDPGTTLAAASMALFDGSGKSIGLWNATASDLAKGVLLTAFPAPPGSYRLRVAATDANGRGGSADFQVDAELTPAGPLQLSSLVLGLSRSGGFQPKMQFTTEPAAIAYLEIYNGQAGAALSVVFEVATSVDGQPVLAQPAALAPTSEPDRFQATATIPVGALPPGDFVVRASVKMQDQPEGRVIRTIRKVGD